MNIDIFQKVTKSLRKRGVLGLIRALFADLMEIGGNKLIRMRDHRSNYRFTDRSSGKTTLIIVLAGYKSYLWAATLTRLKQYAPAHADFCVASAGMYSSELEEMCTENDWSYLSVSRNSPGVALNKAIALHSEADYIYKLDEDIFISSDFFRLLREGYDQTWRDSLLEPGFCAPVLNVNGISYRSFLRKLNLESKYQEKFGRLVTRCDNLPVHNNPDASWWLWKNTLPFDQVGYRFARESSGHYSVCNTRFSIGAILFRRAFLNSVGGFKSAWHSAALGVDEDMLCRDCVSQSRPMYVIESVLAGHFSFYPQEALMKEKLPELSHLDPTTFPTHCYSTFGH